MQRLQFEIGLLVVLLGCFSGKALSEKVCSRLVTEPVTRFVTKPVVVTYHKRYFLSWRVATRIQFQNVPVVSERWKNEYYCCDGYEGDVEDCKPICSLGCKEHSHCTEPEQCSCDEGYEGDDCTPACNSCGANSYCHAPNVCACNSGYVTNESGSDCLPVCDQGYEPSTNGTCQPICPEACTENSSCTKPGECECNDGFMRVQENCQPICAEGCPEHSKCTAPDQCICDTGYVFKEHSKLCEPQCPPCKVYARCVAPDRCECYDGYELVEGECKPKCSQGCPNGFCFGPETCACKPGYLMGPNHTCEPQCTPPCLHGKCIAPDSCECEPGYIFAADSKHDCKPVCEPVCEHGFCVAPQLCICDVGYQPLSEKMLHVCRSAADQAVTERQLDELKQQPATNCSTSSCHCWQEWSEVESAAIKCINVCRDTFDKPCLDLQACTCEQATHQLLCHDGDKQQRLTCQVPKPTQNTDQASAVAAGEAARNSHKAQAASSKWPKILGWCVGSVTLLLLAIGTSHLYLKHRRQRFLGANQLEESIGVLGHEEDL